jgi:uncharacterized protein (DUF2164 family)
MLGMKLPREEKEPIIDEIIAYMEEERGETLGRMASEQLLDFMLELLGPHVYNHAIADARALALERMRGLEDDLYALEKRIGRTPG